MYIAFIWLSSKITNSSSLHLIAFLLSGKISVTHSSSYSLLFNLFNFSVSVDIDECEIDAVPCDQVCENTEGSFFCTCFSGFELTAEDNKCQGYSVCAHTK